MARATRSSATQVHDEKTDQHRTKSSSKKRKRTDNDDHPRQKQLRVKDEEDILDSKLQNLQLAADVPIDASDAQQILHILEPIDSQALLDRVFPLSPSDLSEPSTSKSQSGSFSLRALLREPSKHPLRVLRAAVQNLFPISYHPRSRASTPAAQQLRFCNLAASLLDQASFHSVHVPLPLDIDSVPFDPPESSPTTESKPTSRSEKHAHLYQIKKYALMQRLPFGTWWSSLNSDIVPADSKPLKDVSTANAELAAILPSPSAPAPVEADSVQKSPVTLASYVPKKPPGYKPKLPGPRGVSCGTFLDYGPYASFAPVFEQDGVEVGRSTLGELYCRWADRKKRWSDERTLAPEQPEDQVAESPQPNDIDTSCKNSVLDDEKSFEGLFSSEQISLLKQALGSLELEAAVQELLERNANALKRLEELQNKRLSKPGEFTPVEEGSEEWDIAQGILDSFCLLTSLRPRLSTSDHPPLIPSPSALHKLQRTLPIAPTQGWHGTLPAEHPTALRDDSTLYIKSTTTAVPTAPAAPPPHTPTLTPIQPATAQATAATAAATAQAYAGYPYNYATPYRTGYQYKLGQPYYPNAAYATQTTAQAQATSQYYQAQPYGATGQQQYTYSSWYQYNPQTQSSTSAAGSRKGTPQPSAAAAAAATSAGTTPAMPTSYAGFFSAATQTPGQRAVANTVATATASGKPYQPTAGGAWTAPSATGYVASTLPPHMRNAVTGQPGPPGVYNAGLYQPNYYGAYQATPSPAQS
ncbi:hypothetical protein EV363DRAFT_1250019 [Boletus edulis]|nr:hypothetical protein EV363DRAFT_1250019 [Boletus edulis]